MDLVVRNMVIPYAGIGHQELAAQRTGIVETLQPTAELGVKVGPVIALPPPRRSHPYHQQRHP